MSLDLLRNAVLESNERAIVRLFQSCVVTNRLGEDRLPIDCVADKFVYWMNLPQGQADIVIFHADGSASVIEVKDGDAGTRSVVGGIGQVAYYAVQLGWSKARLKRIHRGLLWTSVGDNEADARIEEACEQAGVVPLPWGPKAAHLDAARASLDLIGRL